MFFIIGYTSPLVIGPLDDLNTTNTAVLFEFEKAGAILIDDNPSFTSPEKIYTENNLVINLKPGVYYWKVEGVFPSEIRKLTIESEIELKLREKSGEEKYEIVNAGNTELNIDIYDNEKFTGSIILEVDDSKSVEGTKFIGGENG